MNQLDIDLRSIRGLKEVKQGVKDKDKDKDKDTIILLSDYKLKDEKEYQDHFEYITYRYAKNLHKALMEIYPNSVHLPNAKLYDWVKEARKICKKSPQEVMDVFYYAQTDDSGKAK